MADGGRRTVVADCEEVHHVASPILAVQPGNPGELMVRADLVVRGGRLHAESRGRVTGAVLHRVGHDGSRCALEVTAVLGRPGG